MVFTGRESSGEAENEVIASRDEALTGSVVHQRYWKLQTCQQFDEGLRIVALYVCQLVTVKVAANRWYECVPQPVETNPCHYVVMPRDQETVTDTSLPCNTFRIVCRPTLREHMSADWHVCSSR